MENVHFEEREGGNIILKKALKVYCEYKTYYNLEEVGLLNSDRRQFIHTIYLIIYIFNLIYYSPLSNLD